MNIELAILLGSDSDFPYMEKGLKLLKNMNINFDIEVSSAHRTPDRTIDLVKKFEDSGAKVIIAAAGGAAHLPGVIAAQTQLPVLGVPITSSLSGIDSLYSIVQMPGGIPVATFGIGQSGCFNAILFALQIISVNNEEIKEKIKNFRKEQQESVLQKSAKLKEKIDKL